MQQVLVDGTSVVSASRLLDGEDPPNALNFWSLSLLIECLILHESIIVLDTSTRSDELDQRARIFGQPIRVERRSVRDVVDHYIEMELPEFAGLHELSGDRLRHFQIYGPPWGKIDKAESHLQGALERSYGDDSGMVDYLSALQAVHSQQVAEVQAAKRAAKERQRSRLERFLRGRFPTLAFLRYGFSDDWNWGSSPPYADGTALGALSDKDTIHAWEDFVERYTQAANSSTWHAGAGSRASRRNKFTMALLLRTHFYIIASEVLGAPYRPDILRSPICWKFFDRGSFSDFAMEERLVDAAEKIAQERVRTVNEFLGRPAFAALPLFLGHVFSLSNNRAELVDVALEIRASKAAARFRERLAELSALEATGDFESILREINRYSRMLTESYASKKGVPDVVWSLGSSALKAGVAPSPVNAIGLGVDTGKGAVVASGAVGRWWYRRKMALISKSIKQASKADALQPQLERLFGAEMEAEELRFIERTSALASQDSSERGSAPES